VTNGVYAPVSVNAPLTVQSVNGPGVTVINGGGSQGCAYLTNGAAMSGFTLTNGVATDGYGGGVYGESSAVASNCVLSGNSAEWEGGGAYGGTLNNCTLTGNSATYLGGGAYGGTLNNCALAANTVTDGYDLFDDYYPGDGGGAFDSTLNNCRLTGNSAYEGGGAVGGTLNNCVLTGNSAPNEGVAFGATLNNCTLIGNFAGGGGDGGGAYGCTLNNCIVYLNSRLNYDASSTLNYCCTTPLPTNGVGNITSAPLFVDQANGNLRLQTNSPCINAGNNAYVVGSTDLDGNPRIVGGTVDIGAYEFQTPTSVISYAWLQQYGLPINTNTDTADPDGTGMNNYQDWIAGLNPTNALSVLKLLAPASTNSPAGLVVTWESVNTRTYYLQRSTDLAAQPAFATIQANLVGQAGTTSYTDPTATNAGPYFYRVGVGH
jgi:hypothetical protein